MRIIEPNNYQAPVVDPPNPKKKKIAIIVIGIVLLALIVASLYIFVFRSETKDNKPTSTTQKPAGPPVVKIFSSAQFTSFYENFNYPNVQAQTTPPVITGDESADTHIRAIAQSRGYKLRKLAVLPLTAVDGFMLQKPAADAWKNLKAAAASDGINLRIVSGYRSPADQRGIFLGALNRYGFSVSEITAGKADNAINSVLLTMSAPGYSRHHTGYTFDLGCNNGTLEEFEKSPCFTWISKDNYLNAKKFGWIPSYPSGSSKQGPEPEPWEYVWVGTDSLYSK